jgi:hypothetical protein
MWSWLLVAAVVLVCQSGLLAGFNSISDIMSLLGL